ncbi:MAG: acyltransferase family protein [Actinomycetota bacterium]
MTGTTTRTPDVGAAASTPPAPGGHDRGHFQYQPALDGLRAVAVLSVFAYHLDLGWAKGGFLGVDMFFVLSGYLITSLLLVEWRTNGSIRFGAFWARRARRLLPAVFVVLIVVAIWGRIVLPSSEWGSLRADSLWTLFYGANWHFIWAGQSYFSPNPSPLRHAWSLAIEEQFYLVWPLVVYAALRLARGRTWLLGSVAVVGIVGSLYALGSHFTPGADPSRAYYGTDARASQMLVGALLGMLLLRWTPVARVTRVALQVASIGAVVVIVWAFANADNTASRLYHGGFLAFALCVAVLVAAMVQPTRNPIQRAFSLRPVRWIGAVSYGIYLWHWPIIVYVNEARTGLSGWSLDLLRVALTFGVAALSYYLIEMPIRQHRFLKVWTPRVAVAGGLAATVAIIFVAAVGATPPDPLRGQTGSTLEGAAPPTALGPADPSIPTSRVLLLGDSVAFTLGDALAADAARQGVTVRAIGRLGCGMTTGIALNSDGTRVAWSPGCASDTVGYQNRTMDEVRPDTVLWLSTWELSDHEVDGKRLRFGTPAFDAWLLGEMEATRERVAAHDARLALVTVPPIAENPLTEASPAQAKRAQHLNELFRQFAREHPDDVVVVDLAEIVCRGGAPCPVTVDGIVLRPEDGIHYKADGAAWVSPQLLDTLYAQLRTQDTRRPATTAPASG